MKFKELYLKESYLISPEPHSDNRGLFNRIFCKDTFSKIGLSKEIVQINQSITYKQGSIRGMHFQIPPKSEIKLVRCINGAVYDIIVDIRKNSPTFLKWVGVELSAKNMQMILIPEGFAHGFQTLEDYSEMLYLHTTYYEPDFEGALNYNDPLLGLKWPLQVTEVSEKDRKHSFINTNFKGLSL